MQINELNIFEIKVNYIHIFTHNEDLNQTIKLTDLNIDCLKNIFEYLNFRDLLSVASSNKRLNHATKFIFDRECKRVDLIF